MADPPLDPYGADDTEQFTLDMPAVDGPTAVRHVARHRRSRSWLRVGSVPVYAATVGLLAGAAFTVAYLVGGDPVARSDRWVSPGPQASSSVHAPAPSASATPSPRRRLPVDQVRPHGLRPRLVPPTRTRLTKPNRKPSRQSSPTTPTPRSPAPSGSPQVAPSPSSPCPPTQTPGEVQP